MKIAIFVLLVAFAATAFASVRFPRAAGATCSPPYNYYNTNYSPHKSVYNEFDRVYYTCKPGYTDRNGVSSVKCYLGFWSGTWPTCLSN
ncbi:unnamed protein product [Clavelina lepadiformis]|uniref:Sushi domain-containing protein n=1 Tax=Clavelina lepadiformis TaxID=159417 RepID=A0ABP0FRY8_CLALP